MSLGTNLGTCAVDSSEMMTTLMPKGTTIALPTTLVEICITYMTVMARLDFTPISVARMWQWMPVAILRKERHLADNVES